MKKAHFGFSFIEIIITISILILLSVVGVSYTQGIKDKSNNSKIVSDISSLENSFQTYIEENKSYIPPSGNKKYFQVDTTYAHDETDAYGVSGFATELSLPKQYLSYLPIDPRSQQYYGYASTMTGGYFEIAGVIKNNSSYQSLVSGNYVGKQPLSNLVREYNGPNFVFNNSLDYFPYNPQERILTANIHNASGSILVNGISYSPDEIESIELIEGDTIEIGTGKTADLYISDGSISSLGDSTSATHLTLEGMRYIADTNIATQVKLALNLGSVWTKASKLDEKSTFEISTIDAVAAVRGTIFGVKKDSIGTNAVLIEGKIDIANTPLDVEKGEAPQGLFLMKGSQTGGVNYQRSSTGALETIPSETKEEIIDNIGKINSNIALKVIGFEKENFILTFESQPIFTKATHFLVNKNITPIQSYSQSGITLNISQYKGILLKNIGEIQICREKACSKPFLLSLDKMVSFNGLEKPSLSQCNGIDIQGSCGENLLGNNWEVVLYAPFDTPGDVNMYRKDGEKILSSQDGVTNNYCYFKLSDDGSSFINNTCSDKSIYIERIKNLTEDFQMNFSWFHLKNGFKGIFLDNSNYTDSLKYTFDPSVLSGSFAIEMQIRSEALKRKGENYYLLDGGNGNKLYNNYGVLQLHDINLTYSTGSLERVKSSGISTLYLIQDDTKTEVKIDGISILTSRNSLTNNSYYNIGNKASQAKYYNQWNDVIDYVKIYKKTPNE